MSEARQDGLSMLIYIEQSDYRLMHSHIQHSSALSHHQEGDYHTPDDALTGDGPHGVWGRKSFRASDVHSTKRFMYHNVIMPSR